MHPNPRQNTTFSGLTGGFDALFTAPHRFSFNGMEVDVEVGSTDQFLSAEYWEYDTYLGRRWNIDPILKHWESPYATFRNSPILYIDPSGTNASSGGDGEEACDNLGGSGSTNTTNTTQAPTSKLTGSSNLIVYITDGAPLNREMMDKESDKWDYVAASNLNEASKVLHSYYRDRKAVINNLVIRSHGGFGQDQNPDDGISQKGMVIEGHAICDPQTEAYETKQAFEYMKGLVNDNGVVLLTACGLESSNASAAAMSEFWISNSNRTLYMNFTNSLARKQPDINRNRVEDDPQWFNFNQFMVESKGYAGFRSFGYSIMLSKVVASNVYFDVKVNSKLGKLETNLLNIPLQKYVNK